MSIYKKEDVLKNIKLIFKQKRLMISRHADRRMKERGFCLKEIIESLNTFEIIEEYQEDKPFPSFLIWGKTHKGRVFHQVIAYNEKEKECIIITIYEPDEKEWVNNYKKRRV